MGRERRRRTWGQRAVIGLLAVAGLGAAVLAAGLADLARVTASIDRLPVSASLDPGPSGRSGAGPHDSPVPELSFLVVGVDGADGTRDDVGGARNVLADSMMVVRTTPTGAEVLPLPRDLWGEIPGHGTAKLNAAMAHGATDGGPGGGPALLIETIRVRFGLEVNHYVQVDFDGFVDLVDHVGGIDLYVPTPARDPAAELELGGPGCTHLDGAAALRLARSRSYESLRDGDWDEDPSADLGRIRRQQVVLRAALTAAVARGVRNPVTMRRMVTDAAASLALDDALSLPDLLALAQALRGADVDAVTTHALEVEDGWEGGQSVLRLRDTPANEAVLARFRPQGTQDAGAPGAAGDAGASAPPGPGPSATAPSSAPSPPPPAPAAGLAPDDPLARYTPSLRRPDGTPC